MESSMPDAMTLKFMQKYEVPESHVKYTELKEYISEENGIETRYAVSYGYFILDDTGEQRYLELPELGLWLTLYPELED